MEVQNDEISLKELIEKGREWFSYLLSLMVIDYAIEDELGEAALLWENQISDLKHVIGSV